MSKRGLSMEEKKVRMLELFHESREFYTIKELEKLAPKLKGIVQPSVKEVVDDLVGDALVQMDKIGTGNYYWSFPSAAGATKHAALAKSRGELDTIDKKLQGAQAGLEAAEAGREDTAERRKLLATLSTLNATSHSLQAELAAFGAADPVRYERKKRAIDICKEAALRWTDNTMILMQIAGTFGVEEKQVREMLGIGEDWEDLKT